MLSMILKMSAISALYIVLTVFLWKYLRNKKISFTGKILIGLIYGMCSVLSTHFGVDFGDMLLNLRDVAPLAAGLFFHPLSGVIAGLIGGIERYIVGTYFGIGSYTRIACSVSTCLAGFVALLMNLKVFRGKKPSPMYAFFMGAVMEVFHMYAVFISHRADMRMAFVVVRACSIPMIIFSGIALAVMSIILEVIAGEWKNPFKRAKGEDISVSQTFQRWLFVVTVSVIFINFIFSFILQTQSAYQNGYSSIIQTSSDIKNRFKAGLKYCVPGASEYFEIIKSDGTIIAGKNIGSELSETVMDDITGSIDKPIFKADYMGEDALNKVDMLSSELILLTYMPHDELFWNRNAQAYETAFADILLFTVIYVLIAFLVRQIVVKNIDLRVEFYSNNGKYYAVDYWGNPQYWNEYTGDRYTRQSRLKAEQAAMDVLIQSLLGKNDPDTPGKGDLIEISVVSFADERQTGATEYLDWTSSDYTGLMTAINQTTTPSGTNWEDALIYAKEQADIKKQSQPDEDMYVIFLTDGEPTAVYGEKRSGTNGAFHYDNNEGGFEYALTENGGP